MSRGGCNMHTRQSRKCTALVLCWLIPVLTAANAQGQEPPREISITTGDYHYAPDVIEAGIGQTIVLHLTNTDSITPHNFTLVDKSAGLDVDTDIGAGSAASISLTPRYPGSYTWYCNKKLPFMKSHRDRGMYGTLVVR